MGFTPESHLVRVDFFKDGGKWGYTEQLNMGHDSRMAKYDPTRVLYSDTMTPIHAVALALMLDDRLARMSGSYTVVVLEPYHKADYPVMLLPGEAASVADEQLAWWRRQDVLVDADRSAAL